MARLRSIGQTCPGPCAFATAEDGQTRCRGRFVNRALLAYLVLIRRYADDPSNCHVPLLPGSPVGGCSACSPFQFSRAPAGPDLDANQCAIEAVEVYGLFSRWSETSGRDWRGPNLCLE